MKKSATRSAPMDSKKKMIRLKNLTTDGNANLFERLKLAQEIMQDSAFIDSEFGDEIQAYEKIESSCFSMLRGFIGLHRLLQIFAAFPDEKMWLEYNYDLVCMNDLCRKKEREQQAAAKEDEPEGEEAPSRRSYKKEFEDLQLKFEKLKEENGYLEIRVKRLEKEVRDLEEELSGFREPVIT